MSRARIYIFIVPVDFKTEERPTCVLEDTLNIGHLSIKGG